MTITLTYTTTDGTQEQIEFENSVKRLKIAGRLANSKWYHNISIDEEETGRIEIEDLSDFRGRMKSIDLLPLSACTNLQEFGLIRLGITSIDLSPLTSCHNLQILSLQGNQIGSVDLTPLTSCSNLRELYLFSNKIESIDLSPIRACKDLRKLFLGRNEFHSIDLSSLASCRNLEILWLRDTKIKHIDLRPLSNCEHLSDVDVANTELEEFDLTHLPIETKVVFDRNAAKAFSWLPRDKEKNYQMLDGATIYKRPRENYSWAFLHKVVIKYGHFRSVQHDILKAIGLGQYGFIDFDFKEFLCSLPHDTTTKVARELLMTKVLDKVISAIDRDRAITGLRVENLLNQHEEIALRFERIMKLRTTEIRKVRVGMADHKIDLSEFWLTSYGYEIMKSLQIPVSRIETTQEEFSRDLKDIREALEKMGMNLKTNRKPISGVQMNDELKRMIWWFIIKDGKDWKNVSLEI